MNTRHAPTAERLPIVHSNVSPLLSQAIQALAGEGRTCARHAPTAEQLPIVHSNVRLLLVQAFAGAGKTSTLEAFALANPDLRILLLTFTKVLQTEAESRFRQQRLFKVKCKTTHSLAFASFGKAYSDAKKLGEVSPANLMDRLGISAVLARAVLTTVENYMRSGEAKIAPCHFPQDLSEAHRSEVGTHALRAWEMMQDLNGPLKMPHDGYLKLYQLSNPDLSKTYDVIMVDEWQDTNPVTMDVVMRQECRVILVGDKHQSIYAFRGACGAMDKAAEHADEVLTLTQSFRFGQGIADLATLVLSGLKGESHPLIGAGQPQPVVCAVDRSKPYAYIARTNSSLFREAVSLLGRTPFAMCGGDKKDAKYLDRLLDVHHLSRGDRASVFEPFLRRFADADALRAYAEAVDDKELLGHLSTCKEFGQELPGLIQRVKNADLHDTPEDAHVLLLTAHGSKGLQFDQVVLADDFEDFVTERGCLIKPTSSDLIEEANLLYVALSRAKRALDINSQIRAIKAALLAMNFTAPSPDPALLAALEASRNAAPAAAAAPEERACPALPEPTPAAVLECKPLEPQSPLEPLVAQTKAYLPVPLAQKVPTPPYNLRKNSDLNQIKHAIIEIGLLDVGQMATYLKWCKDFTTKILGRLIANGDISERLFMHDQAVMEFVAACRQSFATGGDGPPIDSFEFL